MGFREKMRSAARAMQPPPPVVLDNATADMLAKAREEGAAAEREAAQIRARGEVPHV